MQDGLDPTPGINNQFATIPDVSVDAVANRVAPRQMQTGNVRGSAQVIVGSDGFPQVLIGNQQTFGNGLFVAKPGVDATSNTDANQWIFNSNQNIFKVGITASYTWPSVGSLGAGASTGYLTTQIAHGLGITPLIACSILVPATGGGVTNPWAVPIYAPWNNRGGAVPYNHSYTDANGLGYILVAGADSTYLYLAESIGNVTVSAFTTEALTFTYYVYANSAV